MFSIIRRQGTLSIKKRKKIRKRIFFIIVLLFTFFLLFAGKFLVVDEAPKATDVIVVLSGGEGRLEKAYELYQSGYARKMIVSNGLADNLWESAIRLLPRKSVILERKADSTYESAVYVKKIMKKHKYHSALIVSSDYHMRRVKYNFSRVYKDSDTKLIYVASNSTYDPKAWWLSKQNVGITISEYIKIIGNTFGIYGNDAKRKLYQYIEVFFYE